MINTDALLVAPELSSPSPLDFQPLRVIAHMATGVACATPWGIALDGLLASELRAIQKQLLEGLGSDITSAMDDANPPDLRLPLARCTISPQWHWAATCGFPEDPSIRPDVHTWTGRIDARHADHTSHYQPATVDQQRGRYKAHRMPLLVTPTRRLTWFAIGDAEAIQTLLEGITAIGKKRSQGEGHVLAWEVIPTPLDDFTAAHCYPDGTLGRPTPPECLAGRSNLHTHLGSAGLRPPYMHPSRRAQLYLPHNHSEHTA